MEGDASTPPTKILTASRDVLGVYGDFGYYVVEGDLIRFDINSQDKLEEVCGDVATLVSTSNYLDFDNRYVYSYGKYTAENGEENYYLTFFEQNCTPETYKQRFVGVFENGDTPAKPEQPTAEYEGDEVEYLPHID